MTLIDDPEHLRLRAADMRRRADNAVYPETKQGLLRIADDYDVLAIRAERRLAVLAESVEAGDLSANAGSATATDPGNLQGAEPPDESGA
jgi:hypothetical protein